MTRASATTARSDTTPRPTHRPPTGTRKAYSSLDIRSGTGIVTLAFSNPTAQRRNVDIYDDPSRLMTFVARAR